MTRHTAFIYWLLTRKSLSRHKLSTQTRDHHRLPPWIRSFDLFRHWRVALFPYGVHDLFFLEVCIWGRVSGVWCCPFFQDCWTSFIFVWISERSKRSHTKRDRLVLQELGYCGWAGNPPKENKILISKETLANISK